MQRYEEGGALLQAELEADIIVAEDIPGKAKIYDFLEEHAADIEWDVF